LPDGLDTPRCFGVREDEDGGWIWLEHIVESTGRRWSHSHFHQAARQVGRFAGAYLTGRPLPVERWLSAPFFRSVFADGNWWATYMDPAAPYNAWQKPVVQQAFGEPLRSRVLKLWDDKRIFFDAFDQLPQVLCHNDLHRRNLMWRIGAQGEEELVALDWAFCGPGAVGMDMGELIATSTYFFESDPAQVGELEATVLDGYLAGLRTAGWMGDARLVRLGYLSSAALWMGATLPGWAAYMLGGDFTCDVLAMYGRPAAEVLAGWVTLTEFLLERADEARWLMRTLCIA
jgi:hypothetical protein